MTSDKGLFEAALIRREGMFSRVRDGLAAMLEPSSGLVAVPADSPVHFDMIREDSVLTRLAEQLGFAFGELRRDPANFIKVVLSPDTTDPDQLKTRQAAWALTVAVPVMVFGAFVFGIALYFLIFGRPVEATEMAEKERVQMVNLADMPDLPKAAERSGGGGGGGREEVTPPMKGKLPETTMKDPIVAPTTHTPVAPSLPIPPQIKAAIPIPAPNPDEMGDPNGVAGPPSDGPGKGHGIGTGSGGGVGSGDGIGAGPGSGWNMGGGDPRIGGGGRDDPNSKVAQTKAKVLNSPRPAYTEQARQNKTQGNVMVKAQLGANGRVKSASVVRGLPDGLNEKAIEAVHKLSFVPARNAAGVAIDSWLTVSVNFTIR